jgi:hypothetical protein
MAGLNCFVQNPDAELGDLFMDESTSLNGFRFVLVAMIFVSATWL